MSYSILSLREYANSLKIMHLPGFISPSRFLPCAVVSVDFILPAVHCPDQRPRSQSSIMFLVAARGNPTLVPDGRRQVGSVFALV